MHQTRSSRPFIVEIKSSRRTARKQGIASIWGSVDIAAVNQIVSGDMTDQEIVAATTVADLGQTRPLKPASE